VKIGSALSRAPNEERRVLGGGDSTLRRKNGFYPGKAHRT